MPDHEPFDGTIPYVEKHEWMHPLPQWRARRPKEIPMYFPTWREAMNYATKEDHR